MDNRDHTLPDELVDHLYLAARLAGIYYQALIKQGLPAELAGQLVRDWRANTDAVSREPHRTFQIVQ